MRSENRETVLFERDGLTDIRAEKLRNGTISFYTVRKSGEENLRTMLPKEMIDQISEELE